MNKKYRNFEKLEKPKDKETKADKKKEKIKKKK
jgi:hypothetical protein